MSGSYKVVFGIFILCSSQAQSFAQRPSSTQSAERLIGKWDYSDKECGSPAIEILPDGRYEVSRGRGTWKVDQGKISLTSGGKAAQVQHMDWTISDDDKLTFLPSKEPLVRCKANWLAERWGALGTIAEQRWWRDDFDHIWLYVWYKRGIALEILSFEHGGKVVTKQFINWSQNDPKFSVKNFAGATRTEVFSGEALASDERFIIDGLYFVVRPGGKRAQTFTVAPPLGGKAKVLNLVAIPAPAWAPKVGLGLVP